MRRVLKANGRLLFVEHGLAPDESVRWSQHRLTPAWQYISGGCHLNRPIQSFIVAYERPIANFRRRLPNSR